MTDYETIATVTNVEDDCEELDSDELSEPEKIVCVVVQSEEFNEESLKALKNLQGVVIEYSKDASEYLELENLSRVKFFISNFGCEVYANIRKITSKIFGPTVIQYCARNELPLPNALRPLYCNSMSKLVACFAGFKIKEELTKLIALIHHMGGSVRKDFSPSVTHLIANSTSGEKYQYAVNLGKPVLSPDWVFKCWEHRNEVDFAISSILEVDYKVPPFLSCKIAFCGFSLEEQQHMEEMTVLNGGTFCPSDHPEATHVVLATSVNTGSLDENLDSQMEFLKYSALIIKVEWFWISIQISARAAEHLYFVKMGNEHCSSSGTPYIANSHSRAKKRKRLKETLGQLATLNDAEAVNLSFVSSKQRRSDEITLMSCSPSMLDITVSPTFSDERELESENTDKAAVNTSLRIQSDVKSISPRMQIACEMLQTETNYVGILHTIITMVKEPIEDLNQVGGPLLDPTEVKIIFGNVRPIYDVHVKLQEDLKEIVNSWSEDKCIGQLIVKYSEDLLKAYPPFINFFEKTKEMLLKCDASKPRFHAFLKICQGKPEFGRQSLVELLIRPVQRLPSVYLLLTGLLKKTSSTNPDYAALEQAIDCLKNVMENINEDKRKTDGQVAMFKLVHDIENCPPNLLSSHRHLTTSVDVLELGNGVSGKGDPLTLFLFTDVIEICKRRKYATNYGSSSTAVPSPSALVVRSASVVSLHSNKAYQKRYKHIELLPLSHIRLVVDVNETEDCHNAFALVCRNQDQKDRLYSFVLLMEEQDIRNGGKLVFLRSICANLANFSCRQNVDNFLKAMDPMELDITGDISTNTLSKAARFASKTTKKVGRVLSFPSKTPRKLTRAMSTMFSPLTKVTLDSPDQDVFATPLALAAKRFPCASTLNLQSYDSPSRKTLTSPSIGKKIKSFTLGPSSLLKRK